LMVPVGISISYLSNEWPTQLGGPVRETEPAVSACTVPAK
jgi:hypothetical protein